MRGDKELLRLVCVAFVGTVVGCLLGLAAAGLTEDAALALVVGGCLGLAIGLFTALFWPVD